MKKVFIMFLFTILLLPIGVGATVWQHSGEMYEGTDYAYNWYNGSSEDSVRAEMRHIDSGVGNDGGKAGVWLAKKGSAGSWSTMCKADDYIQYKTYGDSYAYCQSTSSSNDHQHYDSHGKWNTLDGNWRSIKGQID